MVNAIEYWIVELDRLIFVCFSVEYRRRPRANAYGWKEKKSTNEWFCLEVSEYTDKFLGYLRTRQRCGDLFHGTATGYPSLLGSLSLQGNVCQCTLREWKKEWMKEWISNDVSNIFLYWDRMIELTNIGCILALHKWYYQLEIFEKKGK